MKRLWAKLFGPKTRGTVTVSAVVTRADGTVENLGVIAKGPMYVEAKKN
jgi:hypothetical protein